MDVPRDPMGRLLAGLSLLANDNRIQLRYNPAAGPEHRWMVEDADDERPLLAEGETFFEAVTGAYRGLVDRLEGEVQRQAEWILQGGRGNVYGISASRTDG